MTSPTAGWYPDPNGSGLRYWDGTQWGQARKGAQGVPWWAWLLIAAIAIAVGCMAIFAVGLDPKRHPYSLTEFQPAMAHCPAEGLVAHGW